MPPIRFFAFLLGVVCLLAPAVRAGQPFVGGSVGRASLDVSPLDVNPSVDFAGDDTGYKLFGGYRFGRFLAIEGGLLDLGTIEDQVLGFTVQAEVKGVGAYAVGNLSAGRILQFFGKAGFARWDLESVAFGNGGSLSQNDSGTDFAYGIGAAIRANRHVALRFEWEVLQIETADDVSFASVGLEIGF